MAILLGCIADDFTGATDLANTLVRQGMRTVQLIGVPELDAGDITADAVVIALKSRTIAAADAVAQSLRALQWLQNAACKQFFFKYCSTFDSTPLGNIGPVGDVLLDALGAGFAIACPAFPQTGRTIYKGHLFVGDVLLNQCGMQNHPLTPMTDANLVSVLDAQSSGEVGLVQFASIDQGAAVIKTAFDQLEAQGCRYAITDALEDRHLWHLGEACMDMPLITGGSGIAIGLPENFRRKGLLKRRERADKLPHVGGKSAVLAGSCSQATLAQIASMQAHCPALQLDPFALAQGAQSADSAFAWAREKLADGPLLIYASAPPEQVRNAQAQLGRAEAGALIEQTMAEIAKQLVEAGVRRLVIAGGETSGAVVNALGIRGLQIGPQIDPGVPWTATLGETPLLLALKSGNFGGPDFFLKALNN